MNKYFIVAVPIVAVIALAGLALAHPLLNTQDLTQEQKDLSIQMLELKQQMIGDQIAYLRGEITQDQYEANLQQRMQGMKDLMGQAEEAGLIQNGMVNGMGMHGSGRMHGMGMMGF
ncbi:MAG: hypothetical protein HY367_03020 [Candidatus Aenigmarchaeota archaeon]|nr:hypothetical protein [Candidatus Aenigmarchaeota archaeon]